jgi:nucleotide-binding universal stress UspA family protein
MSARPRRILVGFDGSPEGEEALQLAARLAREDHATLVVVLVLPWPCLAPGPMTALVAQLVQECECEQRRALHEAIARLPDDVSVTFLSRHGRATGCLRRTAAEHDCDLVVVPRSRWARRLRRGGLGVVATPTAAAHP